MPTYTFRNKETEEEHDKFMSWSASQKYLEENPQLERVISAPATITHTGNVINKTSGDWKDLMKNIKKGSGSGNNIKT